MMTPQQRFYLTCLAQRARCTPALLFEQTSYPHRIICYLAWTYPHGRSHNMIRRAIGLSDDRRTLCGAHLGALLTHGLVTRLDHRYTLDAAILEPLSCTKEHP